jgi:hypothetical protein
MRSITLTHPQRLALAIREWIAHWLAVYFCWQAAQEKTP